MSVLIKGIKMPQDCSQCGACTEDEDGTNYCGYDDDVREVRLFTGKRPAWCPLVEADDGECQWIPVEYHEITEEERQENNYPADWYFYIDSPMPEYGQEILITTIGGNVEKDTCYNDGDGYYTDNGYDWCEDIIAWMPLPEPYKKDGELNG